MSKKPPILIIVLIVIYLAGLLYLSLSRPSEPIQEQETSSSQQIAPDGTVIRGPTAPPVIQNQPDVTRGPLEQSTGPTSPPPQ